MTTIQEIYEESDYKRLTVRVVIGGVPFNVPLRDISWSFNWAQVPTMRFVIPNPAPSVAQRLASIALWVGFDDLTAQVFDGKIVSVGATQDGAIIQAAGRSRGLDIVYRRETITLDDDSATEAVTALMVEAGVTYYFVDLPVWQLGTPDPITLEFQSFGEAINRIAEVDGSPWFEMPDGQVRVELRDMIPAATYQRIYFGGVLTGPVETRPTGVTNVDARPRIRAIAKSDLLEEVKNHVSVTGAVDPATQEPFEAEAIALSPWIETPPTYIDYPVVNELIQSQAKCASVAIRHLTLVNRLVEVVELDIDGDPNVSIGMTVRVIDPYTGTDARYIIEGYESSISENDFVTTLFLKGGTASGTTPMVAPVAAFTWRTDLATKMHQVTPAGSGVFFAFDGGASRDFDGTIVSYAWSDSEGNSGTGRFFTTAYNPDLVSSVDVTLIVTDNDGLTDTLTQTVDVPSNTSEDPASKSVIAVAAESHLMLTVDGGETWTDKTKAQVGVSGDFWAVGLAINPDESNSFIGLMSATETTAIHFSDEEDLGSFLDLIAVVVNSGLSQGRVRDVVFVGKVVARDFATHDAWGFVIGVDQISEVGSGSSNGGYVGLLVGDQRDSSDLMNQNNWGGAVLQFRDSLGRGNYPIRRLRHEAQFWVIGGDTRTPSSLVRTFNPQVVVHWQQFGKADESVAVPPTRQPNNFFAGSVPPINGALLTAITAAGTGHHAVDFMGVPPTSAFGSRRSALLFDTGLSPRCWVYDTATGVWSPVTGLPGATDGVCLAKPGSLDENVLVYVVMSNGRVYSVNPTTLAATGLDTAPSVINDYRWENGFPGVYIGGAQDGIVKSLDYNANVDYIRPHTGLGITWPAAANARRINWHARASHDGGPPLYLVASNSQYAKLENSEWVQKDSGDTPSEFAKRLRYMGE